jgi:hypothetical protein
MPCYWLGLCCVDYYFGFVHCFLIHIPPIFVVFTLRIAALAQEVHQGDTPTKIIQLLTYLATEFKNAVPYPRYTGCWLTSAKQKQFADLPY